MKAYTISNGFRQGREAAFGALLMELCIGGERIASFLGIRPGMNPWEHFGSSFVF